MKFVKPLLLLVLSSLLLSACTGITELRSNSGQGTSNVIATFNLNRDIETAAQDVRDRVGTVTRLLPPDAQPPVITKFNSDQSPSLIARPGEQPPVARIERACGQSHQRATRAQSGRWRSKEQRRLGARDHTYGWIRTDWPPISFRSMQFATQLFDKTQMFPAET